VSTRGFSIFATFRCRSSISLQRRPRLVARLTRTRSRRDGPTAAIAQSDGFVFVTPEYNYGPSAVLKNAIDWVYPEWNRKAAGFVSYGSAMGARSVQQLRETAIELQLAPIRSSVHIPVATLWAHYRGGDVDAGLAELEAPAGRLIDDLLWWTAALKTARASAS
jgi:NAD(P)H-dependent FMN reductase